MWTDGRIKAFIISVLRSGSRKWPPKFEALKAAYVGQKINPKSGRLAKHYKCNHCGNEFTSKDVQVDHIDPVICPKTGFVSWDIYITRLFCSSEGLQVLCTKCHDKKTKKEKGIRIKND